MHLSPDSGKNCINPPVDPERPAAPSGAAGTRVVPFASVAQHRLDEVAAERARSRNELEAAEPVGAGVVELMREVADPVRAGQRQDLQRREDADRLRRCR